MSNHDVPIDGNGQYRKNGDGQKPVAKEREEGAERLSVNPIPVPENGHGQREIETTEHEVACTEVDDKVRRRIMDLQEKKKVKMRMKELSSWFLRLEELVQNVRNELKTSHFPCDAFKLAVFNGSDVIPQK